MLPRETAVLVFVLACSATAGCDSCAREAPKQRRVVESPVSTEECASASDCSDDAPCTEERCVDGRCEVTFVAEGTSCDDDTPCNGVATCDGHGRCAAGAPPTIDDGNACTTDSCDPARGVVHEAVPIDDGDTCTTDACDPRSGAVTHASIAIDDGDDCTFDHCDPERGVEHERMKSLYTCDPSCGSGFHAASRRASGACGSRDALQTFCAPDCGDSFYTCAASCPDRYERRSQAAGPQCGPNGASSFCVRR